jgi:uncharacterized protein YkwD
MNIQNLRPKITVRFLLGLSMIILVNSTLFAQSFVGCPTGNERIPSSDETYEQEVLKLINEIREKRKLKPVNWSESLTWAARYHAKDMIVDNYFEHDLHDRRGNRLKKVCNTFEKMDFFVAEEMFSRSENIGAGSTTPAEMVKDWMDSPGHKENILDPETKYMGVAYLYDASSEWKTYWVQCFGMDN